MNEQHIEDIISSIYDMVQEARAMPLAADKCILERDRVLDMLDEIIAQLPSELKQSRTIVESRNELISQARREADAILREEFDKNGLAGKVWQYFIAVPDLKSVGVRDGKRYEGWPAIMRAVNTVDAMTATIEEIPYAVLHHITDRITHEVDGINRVLLDLTPKPIGTIEWE